MTSYELQKKADIEAATSVIRKMLNDGLISHDEFYAMQNMLHDADFYDKFTNIDIAA